MDLLQIFAMTVFIKSFENNGIKTDRETVRLCLKTIDSESVKRRKAHALKWHVYVFQGPNFKWNIYSYDKLKPFWFPHSRSSRPFQQEDLQGVSQALFDDVIRHFLNPCKFPNYI